MKPLVVTATTLLLPWQPAVAEDAGGKARFLSIYRELVETDTSLSSGSCTLAAQRMQQRLAAAGYPKSQFRVVIPAEFPQQGNLVGQVVGSDASLAPVLMLAHIDVVEAKRSDWQRDPFKLIEENGYFYARGAIDDKAMAASWIDALIRYRDEGFHPRRTIKIALTCGEETDANFDGVSYLLQHASDALEAGFAINEGSKGMLDEAGRPVSFGVQVGEKLYQDFTLRTTAVGGHSARPTKDNAIVRLGEALSRLARYRFPVNVTSATRAYFAQTSSRYDGQTREDMSAIGANTATPSAYSRIAAQSPLWNAYLRTTCIATVIEGGHANNAQPQSARANVNCRIMPGEDLATVERQLNAAIADPKVAVTLADAPGPQPVAPRLSAEVMRPIERIAGEIWPGVPIAPALSTGATDGRFLLAAGIPTYGVSGVFVDPDGDGVHGLNERVRIKSLYDAREFLYRLIKAYGAG